MTFKYIINKKEGIITVQVVLPAAPRKSKKVIREPDVRAFLEQNLKEEKLRVGRCIQNNVLINAETPQSKDWVFALDTPTTSRVRSTNEKPQQRSAPEAPKSTRKRRRPNPVGQPERKEAE